MSWYYTYYIGGLTKDGKIIPLGMYDREGKIHPAIEKSRSFASDLHEQFSPITKDMVSEEFEKEFSYEDYTGKKKLDLTYMSYLPINELGPTDYIRKGYFLIEDVRQYEEDGETWDLFYDYLTPQVYAAKLENELKFGPPQKEYDAAGEEYTPHSVRDYMYYAYPNYDSREYEASRIIDAAYMICDEYAAKKKGLTLVAILSQG